jgi:hypothetical protein
MVDTSLSSNPFFKAIVPLIPPGVNEAYMPVISGKTGKPTFIHTPKAKDFLSQVTWYFRDQARIDIDYELFGKISTTHLHVPMSLTLTIYYKTAWRNDSDGPLKITKDALFEHFKFLAEPGCKQWNDNRVVEDHVFKRVDPLHPRFEIEISCALLPTTIKKVA